MKLSKIFSIFFGLIILLTAPLWGHAQSEENNEIDFTSPELLVETFLKDDVNAVHIAEDKIFAAEEAIADADPGSQELADAQQALEDAQAELLDAQLALNEETEQVNLLVADLTEQQIFAFNRSLNNQRHNKFPVNLDAILLQMAIDGDYNKVQINFLTKAYEEEAKFLSFADKFSLKAEETGKDDFLEKAERMRTKAESSKTKFLGRIDAHDGSQEATNINRENAQDSRGAVRLAAKDAVNNAREAAREAAKDSREASREAAREAREAAREAAKEAAKNRGNN